jgi:hypothetical protein
MTSRVHDPAPHRAWAALEDAGRRVVVRCYRRRSGKIIWCAGIIGTAPAAYASSPEAALAAIATRLGVYVPPAPAPRALQPGEPCPSCRRPITQADIDEQQRQRHL